jgi:hypothetical protein
MTRPRNYAHEERQAFDCPQKGAAKKESEKMAHYVKRSLDPMAKIRLQGVKLADPHLLNFWPGECSVRRNLNNLRSPHTLFYRYNKHPSLYAYIHTRQIEHRLVATRSNCPGIPRRCEYLLPQSRFGRCNWSNVIR